MHTYSDEPEPLGRPLLGSVLFHAAVFGLVAAAGYLHFLQTRDTLGSLDASALKVGEVTSVPTIPIPRRNTKPNPLANDTDTDIPKPKPKVRETVKEEPDAIAIKTKKEKKKDRERQVQSTRLREPEEPIRQNQMTSESGRALADYRFGIQGAGGVGMTNDNPFGARFGAYAKQLQQIVAMKWQAQGINVKTAQPAMVTVEIQRDGSYRIVQVSQGSGNYSVDTGAKRALLDVGRFPPLPQGFDRASAVVDFSFRVL